MKLENYKVRVNNESESKEVQGLFSKLGYNLVNNIACENGFLVASLHSSGINFDYWADVKELTIDQLRNLVAAKTKKTPYLVKTIDKWEQQELTSDTPESATCLKIPSWASAAHVFDGYVFFTYLPSVAGNTV